MLKAAIDAALPANRVKACLPPLPTGRTIVVGAGKAAASMAAALEENWTGPMTGLVVTRYGHRASTQQIEVMEAGHPTPDSAGETAARRMVDFVSGLGRDDLVICLISGGGPPSHPCQPPDFTLTTRSRSTKPSCGAAPRSRRLIRFASTCRRSKAAGSQWPLHLLGSSV
jgi:glycerate 2-kinase